MRCSPMVPERGITGTKITTGGRAREAMDARRDCGPNSPIRLGVEMNWRRGLLRLWIVVSLTWLLAVATIVFLFPRDHIRPVYPAADGTVVAEPWQQISSPAEQQSCSNARTLRPTLGNPFACFSPQTAEREELVRESGVGKAARILVIGTLPCGVAFVLGLAAFWVGRGFRSREQS